MQGTILNVGPVSTKYLSRVNSSVKKMSPAFAGKCMAVVVAFAGVITEPVRVWWLFSFLTKRRVKYTCEPCEQSSCEIYTRHCQGCETNRNQGGKEGDFWSGHCRSFCRSSSRLCELAPASLFCGSHNHGVEASSSIPQGVHGYHNSHGCLVVTYADHLPHGRR